MNVYYSAVQRAIIDYIGPGGITLYGAKDHSEIILEYPDAIELTAEEAQTRKENSYRTAPEEITERECVDFLEVLPPVGWKNAGHTESFKVSERITGDITRICCRIGQRFFTFNDSIFMKHLEIVTRCLLAFPELAQEAQIEG